MKRRWHSYLDSNICGCGALFRYRRVKKPKIYCRPCRARERRKAAKFFIYSRRLISQQQKEAA